MLTASLSQEFNKGRDVICVSYFIKGSHFLTEVYPSMISLNDLKKSISITKQLLELDDIDIQIKYIK